MNALILLIASFLPMEVVAKDQVDVIEINHFYDEQGRLVFDQVIFYDWSPMQSRYHVRAWRLLKNKTQLPHRNRLAGGFTAVWHDGEVLRKVCASALRESWTQYDPELIEREFLPKEKRKELRKLIITSAKK